MERVLAGVPFALFFPFVRPADAEALARTNSAMLDKVDAEYQRSARAAVLPGGIWHALLCKRGRESVTITYDNHMPLAIASLLRAPAGSHEEGWKCIICRTTHKAKLSKWGFNAHPECIRDLVDNVYYVPKMTGLDSHDIEDLPFDTLTGYGGRRKHKYEYDVLFRFPFRYVPRDWSLYHHATVVKAKKFEEYMGPKRAAREEAEQRAQEARRQAEALRVEEAARRRAAEALEGKRKQAVAKRRAALEAYPQALLVCQMRETLDDKKVLGIDESDERIFQEYFAPLVSCKTTLKALVSVAKKYEANAKKCKELLKTLPPAAIVDVTCDVYTLARRAVDLWLQRQRQVPGGPVHPPANNKRKLPPGAIECTGAHCVNAGAKDCPRNQYGHCCRGCRRHR